MTFVILLSVVALLTAVVGCAAIWGFDMARAREIEQGFPEPEDARAVEARRKAELNG